MKVTLFTADPPPHRHALYAAPRPLPGRLVGHLVGGVYDVAPADQDRARALDGQPVTVVTVDEYEALVVAAVEADGYSRADYEEAGLWEPVTIGAVRGLVLASITVP